MLSPRSPALFVMAAFTRDAGACSTLGHGVLAPILFDEKAHTFRSEDPRSMLMQTGAIYCLSKSSGGG
jgi:hypothetical protein